MATALAVIPGIGMTTPFRASDKVGIYLASSRARNTVRGYRSAFQQFARWCDVAGLQSMPATPETIAQHIAAEGDRLKAATLAHRLAAIGKAHKAAGQPNPIPDSMLIAETFKGIKAVHGARQVQKDPVLTEDLRVMLRSVPDTLLGLRDRALLLVGFAGAFRRSELVSLDVADIAFKPEGLLLTIRRSKTDQEGQGREIAIPAGAHPETDAVCGPRRSRVRRSRYSFVCSLASRRLRGAVIVNWRCRSVPHYPLICPDQMQSVFARRGRLLLRAHLVE
jgi:integrase